MEIFQKAFKRERSKLYQSGGGQINKLAGTGENGFPQYAHHFSSAQEYYESGDLNKSLHSINRAIELSTVDDWKQYAFKANILEELKMYQESINAFEKAIEINPEDINVYALYSQIGDCYMFPGKDEKAVEFYSYAIELKKQYLNSPHEKDIEGMEGGVFLGKQFLYMYINRGNCYHNLGQLEEAEKDFLCAIEFNPDYSETYLLLYHVYRAQGEEEKAMECLTKAIDLGDYEAQRELGLLSLVRPAASYNIVENRAELEECLNVTFEQQDLAEGKRLSLNLINKGVKEVLPYFCLASIYQAEENWKECEEIAISGLEFADGNSQLLNLAGVAICNQGRIREGLQYLEQGALSGFEKCAENYKFWKSAAHN